MKLWVCPNAGHQDVLGATDCPAVRAPLRMDPDDVRRFCLPCSALNNWAEPFLPCDVEALTGDPAGRDLFLPEGGG